MGVFIHPLTDWGNLFKDRKAIFDRLEQVASQANLTNEERARLEEEWKNYNDFFNTVDFAKDEGRAKGELMKQLEIAKNLKSMGLPAENIAQATGLTMEDIKEL